MTMSTEDVIMQYKVELLQELPLDDLIFFAMAERAGLFPLNHRDSILAEKTRAARVTYLLNKIVIPGGEEYLPKLIKIMRESNVVSVKILADTIQAAKVPGR